LPQVAARAWLLLLHIPIGAAIMLKWALIFAIIAVIAGVFGFTGIAAGAASIAKFLFFLFVVLCVIALILGVTVFKAVEK
jgi:uncharacterized membrane protein YtjA (UPF0391 family)